MPDLSFIHGIGALTKCVRVSGQPVVGGIGQLGAASFGLNVRMAIGTVVTSILPEILRDQPH